MSDDPHIGHNRYAWRWDLFGLAALFIVFAAQLFLGSRIADQPFDFCLTKPLWLDEFHTLVLVEEERVDQLLIKLSRGADYNPPGLHLALWLIARVAGPADEVLLRSFCCAVTFTGFAATYFLLRRRFTWEVSAVAVMGMWSSSPLLVRHMFEARFYGYWFATAAVLCLLLTARAKGIWQFVGVAAVAATMCSVHYFGVISLAIICLCQVGFNWRDARQKGLGIVAMAAGVITLGACLPFYLGQRAALPIPTWISAPSIDDCWTFINGFVLNYATTIPIIAYAIQRLADEKSVRPPLAEDADFKLYAGACGLYLLPVVLAVFSYMVQPAHVARYALPAALSYAPLIALFAQRLNRTLLAATAVLFAAVGVSPTTAYLNNPNYRDAAPMVRAAGIERPLIVHSRGVAYPLFRYTRANPDVVRISFLFRGESWIAVDEVERAIAGRMATMFDLPRPMEAEELESLGEFYLLAASGEEQRYKGWSSEPFKLPRPLTKAKLRGFKMTRQH